MRIELRLLHRVAFFDYMATSAPPLGKFERTAGPLELFGTPKKGFGVTIIFEAICTGFGIAVRLPRHVNLAVTEDRIGASPGVYKEPV